MADHEHTRQRFEDHCWQHYMAERERRVKALVDERLIHACGLYEK